MAESASTPPDAIELQENGGSEMARREAALEFVNKAGARLLCPDCGLLPVGTKYAIAVPAANDDARFREALRVLRMDYLPVIRRTLPLGFRAETERRTDSAVGL